MGTLTDGIVITDVVGDEQLSAEEMEDERQNSSSNESIEEDSSASVSTSGSSDEDSDIDDYLPEIEQLREWAIECKIFQTHLDKLLKILRSRLLPTLPKSSKTFLKTNDADYQIQEMEDCEGGMGSFVYLGLAKGLTDCVNHRLHRNGVIELQVHADAMPATKSGTDSFWVLLGKVHFDPDIYQPFVIAVFQGQNKPNNLRQFLDHFVDEFNELHRDGIEISGRNFNITLKCIIADTPARSFLKNTLGHGGICACERCSIYGERVDSTTVYPSVNAEERTDESFRNFEQPEHHHGPSPFLRLLQMINMISFFVLDFMHLCCQGVMKKLIEYWMSGDLNYKLSSRNKIELSNRLKRIRSQIPCEFQRKTRALKHYAKWKATELRFFLLYSGPIVLKGLLKSEQLYSHFLLFHVACRILCSKKVCLKYAKSAKQYLISFFIAMKDLYSPKSQILNVHHLIHLADDVLFMKCSLSMITAFPFENMLGKIQKQLRTAYRPLAQLCRRLHEQSLLRKKKINLPPIIEITRIRRQQVREIKYKQLAISTSSPNNVILLNNGIIMKVQKIFGNPELPEMLQVRGFVWDKDQPIYQYPCDSTKLEMWELKRKASNNVITRPVTSISNKLVQLSVAKEDGTKRCFAVGMLH